MNPKRKPKPSEGKVAIVTIGTDVFLMPSVAKATQLVNIMEHAIPLDCYYDDGRRYRPSLRDYRANLTLDLVSASSVLDEQLALPGPTK